MRRYDGNASSGVSSGYPSSSRSTHCRMSGLSNLVATTRAFRSRTDAGAFGSSAGRAEVREPRSYSTCDTSSKVTGAERRRELSCERRSNHRLELVHGTVFMRSFVEAGASRGRSTDGSCSIRSSARQSPPARQRISSASSMRRNDWTFPTNAYWGRNIRRFLPEIAGSGDSPSRPCGALSHASANSITGPRPTTTSPVTRTAWNFWPTRSTSLKPPCRSRSSRRDGPAHQSST